MVQTNFERFDIIYYKKRGSKHEGQIIEITYPKGIPTARIQNISHMEVDGVEVLAKRGCYRPLTELEFVEHRNSQIRPTYTYKEQELARKGIL